MQCSIHGHKPAEATCAKCGLPFCQECLVNVQGTYYCKDHVSMLIDNNNQANSNVNNQGYSYPQQGTQGPYSDAPYAPPYQPYPVYPYYHYKSKITALLLCIFLGIGGFHRFYVGKIGTGLLWLFTGGLFGIGWFVDIILIASGSFTDGHGYQLR